MTLRLYAELGLLFLAALAGAGVARTFHLPKVTGYLAVGLVLGPSVSNVVTTQDIGTFRFISELALALFMVTVGTVFEAQAFKRFERSVVWIFFGEVLLTVFFLLAGLSAVGLPFRAALILSAVAIATAPGATLMVLQQYRSEGTLTDHVMALVGLNVLTATTLFHLASEYFVLLDTSGRLGVWDYVKPLWGIAGALLIGATAGIVLGFLHGQVRKPEQLGMTLAVTLLIIGGSHYLDYSFPVASLVMGMVLVNASASASNLVSRLSGFSFQVFALFFVLAGCDLHVSSLWKGSPLVPNLLVCVMVYVLARSAGKVLGARWGAHRGGASDEVKKWVGWAILPHAGCALGLAHLAKKGFGPEGEMAAEILFASIVIFELVAPLLVKKAIVSAGEVKVVHLLDHLPHEVTSLRNVFDNLLAAVGYEPWRRVASDQPLVAAHILRTVPKTITPDQRFRDILRHVENRRHNLFPVVGKDGRLLGTISYRELRALNFDPSLNDVMIARDLMDDTPPFLLTSTRLDEALEIFGQVHTDALPVIDGPETRLFVGLVLHGDLLHVMHVTRNRRADAPTRDAANGDAPEKGTA